MGLLVGIYDHLGWAVAVTALGDHHVVDRRRIDLLEPGMPTMPSLLNPMPQLFSPGEPTTCCAVPATDSDRHGPRITARPCPRPSSQGNEREASPEAQPFSAVSTPPRSANVHAPCAAVIAP